MIIDNLEHFEEVTSEVNQVKGAIAQLRFNLEFLSLGANNSIAVIDPAEFLSTSSPGVSISSGKFQIQLQAD